MPQIRPITDLRNTNEISDICHARREPVFITKNGYGDLVVMSIETYEKKMYMNDIYNKLKEAEQSITDGKTADGFETLKSIRKKYEL